MLARDVFEIVPALEDVVHAGRQRGFAPPVELDFAQAIVADDAGAEIGRGSSALVAAARSIASLMATLTGSSPGWLG